MVDKEVFDNLCVSIRRYIKELGDAQDIDFRANTYLVSAKK